MTIPVMVGWQQLLLILIAIIGVALFFSALIELVRKRRVKFIDDEGVRHYRHRRGRIRAGRGASGIVLLLLAVMLLWATFMVQSYIGLTGDIQVARVRATVIEGLPNHMSVQLIQYDEEGKQITDKTYLVKGDRWHLQGNMLKFPTWLNILGLHSGYKLTRLQGQYESPAMEENEKHTVVVLNGGDDDFFKTVYKQAWTSPFVDAAYGNAVIMPADGLTYNVFVSQTGLYAKPAK